MINFQISKLVKKQQEVELALMQTCTERDKQNQLLEELGNKFLLLENDKNELEHLVSHSFSYYILISENFQFPI